jgi:septal ring-binding cell division protein DamX
MANTFQSSGNPAISERRMYWRQRVFFSRVEWGENNCGDVLNISLNGLALQAVEDLNDNELPKMRFQLSKAPAWVEAKGRIAWRNDSKKVAGVEFIDLSPETRKQILLSIFLTSDEREFPKTGAPLEKTEQVSGAMATSEPISAFPLLESTTVEVVPGDRSQQPIFPSVQSPAETQDGGTVSENAMTANFTSGSGVEVVPEDRNQESIFPSVQFPAETQGAGTVSESAMAAKVASGSGVEVVPEDRNQESIFSSVQFPAETQDAGTVSESAMATKVTNGSGKAGRLVGLSLAAVLLLLVVLPLRHYLQRAGTSQKGRETATEPNLPGLSSKISATPTSNPGPTPDHPAPTSNPAPSLDHSAFVLQVGAMVHEENANAVAESLRRMNFPAYVSDRSTDGFHRVVVGPYHGVDAALRAKTELEKRGFQTIRREWKPQAK